MCIYLYMVVRIRSLIQWLCSCCLLVCLLDFVHIVQDFKTSRQDVIQKALENNLKEKGGSSKKKLTVKVRAQRKKKTIEGKQQKRHKTHEKQSTNKQTNDNNYNNNNKNAIRMVEMGGCWVIVERCWLVAVSE